MKLAKVFAVLAVVVLLSAAAFATVAYATHSWGGYHWARTSNPFTLKLGNNLTSPWGSYLGTTSSDWSVSTVLNTSIVPGTALRSPSPRKDCYPTTGRVEVCNRTYGNTGWLGVAQIWVSGLHLTQGSVKVNDSYFNTATYNTSAWRNLVMCQEVGHTLGLNHQDTNFNNVNLGTCMDYTNAPAGGVVNEFDYGLSNEHPNTHDYAMLLDAIMYGHLDSTNTATFSIDGGGKGRPATVGQDIDLNDPSAWGKAVKQDSRGNNSLYERDLGNGNKLFTFVIWVD